ncbi:MAG: hypothetical protein BWX64_02254 [Acidobacteria bacterium ADurb.Bin051]|nr:MAG: hypothetical protein BWX64_02254 [Acidobacteria bacterium ADurb.Bin051]
MDAHQVLARGERGDPEAAFRVGRGLGERIEQLGRRIEEADRGIRHRTPVLSEYPPEELGAGADPKLPEIDPLVAAQREEPKPLFPERTPVGERIPARREAGNAHRAFGIRAPPVDLVSEIGSEPGEAEQRGLEDGSGRRGAGLRVDERGGNHRAGIHERDAGVDLGARSDHPFAQIDPLQTVRRDRGPVARRLRQHDAEEAVRCVDLEVPGGHPAALRRPLKVEHRPGHRAAVLPLQAAAEELGRREEDPRRLGPVGARHRRSPRGVPERIDPDLLAAADSREREMPPGIALDGPLTRGDRRAADAHPVRIDHDALPDGAGRVGGGRQVRSRSNAHTAQRQTAEQQQEREPRQQRPSRREARARAPPVTRAHRSLRVAQRRKAAS